MHWGISGYTLEKWLYSGKVVVFGQSGSIWANVVVFGKRCCIRARWLNSGRVVLFGQSGCILAKVVVFGKVAVFGQKW